LGGKAYQLHAPAFVETRENCELLSSMEPFKEILDIARRASIALLGVGTVDAETSRFVMYTALSAEEMKRIAEECGVWVKSQPKYITLMVNLAVRNMPIGSSD